MKPPPRKIQMSPEKGPFQTGTSLPSLACFILSNVWGHFWNPRISATSKEIVSGTWESSKYNTYWDIMLYLKQWDWKFWGPRPKLYFSLVFVVFPRSNDEDSCVSEPPFLSQRTKKFRFLICILYNPQKFKGWPLTQ